MSAAQIITRLVQSQLGHSIVQLERMGGGDVGQAFRVITTSATWFVKTVTHVGAKDMLAKEARGLQFLRSTETVRVPGQVKLVDDGVNSAICMCYIPPYPATATAWTNLARELAMLHKVTDPLYGWSEDNYIGPLHQSNKRQARWSGFYADQRLHPQLVMAVDSGRLSREDVKLGENLSKRLDQILPNESSSLIHGDLWRGNVLFGPEDTPYLIDPAVYFGHREMDLGMTALFGGFPGPFYEAYNEEFPLVPGWRSRQPIYQLYPLLVHLNLFGNGYYPQVQKVLKTFGS